MGASVGQVKPHIEQRDIHFNVGDHLTPTWMHGDPYLTAFCDALSMLFPKGERFFISSVNAYISDIKDPALKEQVRAFVIQEALHTREHETYNRALAERGCDMALMESRAAAALTVPKSRLSRLAATVAIEHMTAIFAHMVLRDPKFFANTPEALRDLWTWHALEEMEHKGVAYDVYQAATAHLAAWKRYVVRCVIMIKATHLILGVQHANMLTILEARGYPTKGWARLRRLRLLFGRPGYYRRALPHFLAFFLPGFHPWNTREDKAAAEWRSRFATMKEQSA